MTTPTAKDVADVVAHAGQIVGKTKLQKTLAILELMGLGAGFSYSYYLYGPYSEEVAAAADRASLLGLVAEESKVAAWGGTYVVYSAPVATDPNPLRAAAIDLAVKANSIVLELAVTAAFLAVNGEDHPWEMLDELKPEKTSIENVNNAKALYEAFRQILDSSPLPAIH